jgi:hypothetical protein
MRNTEGKSTQKTQKNSPPQDKTVLLNVGLEELSKKVDELCTFTKKNKTVHNEIKNYATEIQSLVFQAASQLKNNKDELTALKWEFDKYKKDQERRFRSLEDKFLCPQECSTCMKNTILELCKEYTDFSYEEFTKCIKRRWTEACYQRVRIDTGDLTSVETENVYYQSQNDDSENMWFKKKILRKYPELSEAEVMPLEYGKCTEMEQRSFIRMAHETREKIRRISLFITPDHEENKTPLEKTFMTLKEMKKKAIESKILHLTIALSPKLDNEMLKKMTEFVFCDTTINVILKLPYNTTKITNNRKETAEKIVIDTGRETYADTLSKIKQGLTKEEKDQITNVKETRNGQILLRIKNNAGEISGVLKKIISERSLKVIKRKNKIIHISGLDTITDENEIKEAILKTIEVKYHEQLSVKPPRPTKNGSQIATVAMEENDARRLLNERKLRIGLSICQLKERLELTKCFKCWEYGHKASNCKGKDRTGICHNCSKVGHQSKECKEGSFCPICETEGHSAGDGRCLAFKKALSDARQNRRIDNQKKDNLN